MKKALVCGAGGFIGSYLVSSLKAQGFFVRGVDLKRPEFSDTKADDFLIRDLRDQSVYKDVFVEHYDEVYQLAADMGGAGFVFTGEHDADIIHNNALINLLMAEACVKNKVDKVLYTSSACIYPEYNQMDPANPKCSENSAYPAAPDSEYGWEKLFSERVYLCYRKNHNLDIRIVRLHNIFGPKGTWTGGREKAPAALSRKVAQCPDGGSIEVWGSGKQTRSFLYIDECIIGIRLLMDFEIKEPLNLGSEEMISINDLAKMVIRISGKNISIRNISGPLGVQGRNSDNKLIKQKLGWAPSLPLEDGIRKTYAWVESQIKGR